MARSRRLLTLCLLVAVTLSLAAPVFGAGKSSGEKGFNQGLQAFKRGNFEAAITSWATAAEAYEREGKPRERLLALMHLAEAYSALGRYREAGKPLGMALERSDADRRGAVSAGQRSRSARRARDRGGLSHPRPSTGVRLR